MDAAQVAHQHTVDKDPHVVVAGEVVGDLFGPYFVAHMAAVLLYEPGTHVQAEAVVDRRIV